MPAAQPARAFESTSYCLRITPYASLTGALYASMACRRSNARFVRPAHTTPPHDARCSYRQLALAAVRGAYAEPAVAHLMVVHDRIVGRNAEPQDLRRQRAGRGQDRVGGHHPVALGGDERAARVDQILLGVEDVERGALADPRFLAYAVERDFGRRHLGR